MEIIVNGEARTVPEGWTAQMLVESMELSGRRIAMEVNQEIVPRGEYGRYRFNDGDKVEVVHAIGGG